MINSRCQDAAEDFHKKNISNIAEYSSVEDPLSIHRIGSNEPLF